MWTLTEYFIMGENLLKEIEKGSKMAVMKKKIITHYIYNGSSTITDLAREMDLSVPTPTKYPESAFKPYKLGCLPPLVSSFP